MAYKDLVEELGCCGLVALILLAFVHKANARDRYVGKCPLGGLEIRDMAIGNIHALRFRLNCTDRYPLLHMVISDSECSWLPILVCPLVYIGKHGSISDTMPNQSTVSKVPNSQPTGYQDENEVEQKASHVGRQSLILSGILSRLVTLIKYLGSINIKIATTARAVQQQYHQPP